MSRGASRTYRFEDVEYDDGTVVSHREALAQHVADFLSTLHVVGGMLSVVAIRDELGDDPVTGQKVFETRGAIVEWRQAAPVRNAAPPAGTHRIDVAPEVLAPLPGEEPDDGDPFADDAELLSEEPDTSELEGATA